MQGSPVGGCKVVPAHTLVNREKEGRIPFASLKLEKTKKIVEGKEEG